MNLLHEEKDFGVVRARSVQTTTTQGSCRLLPFCVGDSSLCQRMRSRHEKAAATSQTVATARASERRDIPCRVPAPHLTRSEEGKGRERSTRRTTRRSSGSTPPSKSPAHSTLRSTTTTVCRSSGAPGLTTSPRSGRRSGFSGTQWNRLATARLRCRFLMFLCR